MIRKAKDNVCFSLLFARYCFAFSFSLFSYFVGAFPDEHMNVHFFVHGVYVIKKKRKQKLVLIVSLVGRISLIIPTFEEHDRAKQNMIPERLT